MARGLPVPPQWIPNYRSTATLTVSNISPLKISAYKTIPFFRQKGDEMLTECAKSNITLQSYKDKSFK